jgi:hypothetical protein
MGKSNKNTKDLEQYDAIEIKNMTQYTFLLKISICVLSSALSNLIYSYDSVRKIEAIDIVQNSSSELF